ncbi:penicillin-binding protein [Oceanobacillus sp. CAU 1775]
MRKNKTTHMMAGIFIILFSILFLVLTGRFVYIQATGEVNNVSLEEWAEQKRTSSYSIGAERGKIYDKNGMILAYDRPTYRVYAILDEAYSDNSTEPKHVVDPAETAEELAKYIDLEASDIIQTIENGLNAKPKPRFQVEFGKAGRQLTQSEKEEIEQADIPGIYFEEESLRYYPNGVFASHIIGFARDEIIETENGEKVELTGITGMEREMNEILRGKDGFISFQRDIYNTRLLDPKEVIQEPEDGDDVYLTLDQKIQTLLDEALSTVQADYNPEKMTGIVMSAKTGEVLAMSSRPSFNPNNPANVENWYNDVISAPVEPGSTVKMFTWAAAIEEGVYNGSEGFMSGRYNVNERIAPIRDHNRDGWGVISFDEGFERSSNVAASKLVWEKIGADRFLDYIHAFDFDKETGIDLPGEIAGSVLYNWPREKLSAAFGQGSTVTPIQMMKAATAIANDGVMLQPYVINKIVDPSTNEVIEQKEPTAVSEPISSKTAEETRELLRRAVEGDYATGKSFRLESYSLGGKTGTAEIPNPDGGGYFTGREELLFSFLGMAPIEDPELIIFVSVQKPELEPTQYGSQPVSFIVRNVMENSLHYLNIDPDQEADSTIEKVKIPKLLQQNTDEVSDKLKQAGIKYTVVGNGKKIIDANVAEGQSVFPNTRVILLTDEPTMPNIMNWSQRDVVQFASMLELQLETFGNGYVAVQGTKEGTPIKKGDYLVIELMLPNEEEPVTEENEDEGVEQEEQETESEE